MWLRCGGGVHRAQVRGGVHGAQVCGGVHGDQVCGGDAWGSGVCVWVNGAQVCRGVHGAQMCGGVYGALPWLRLPQGHTRSLARNSTTSPAWPAEWMTHMLLATSMTTDQTDWEVGQRLELVLAQEGLSMNACITHVLNGGTGTFTKVLMGSHAHA